MGLCGIDCCKECPKLSECGGCEKVKGHPFGGNCVAAKCVEKGGLTKMQEVKKMLIDELNALQYEELVIKDLHLLNGSYVNLEYPLANRATIKFLNDNDVYWGNQIERTNSERCYGVIACEEFLIVCEYGCGGADPKLLLYKSRPERKCEPKTAVSVSSGETKTIELAEADYVSEEEK